MKKKKNLSQLSVVQLSAVQWPPGARASLKVVLIDV